MGINSARMESLVASQSRFHENGSSSTGISRFLAMMYTIRHRRIQARMPGTTPLISSFVIGSPVATP